MRGEKVIIDSALAAFYGVTTKRLNEQEKRNKNRFPADFMFQLTAEEMTAAVMPDSLRLVRPTLNRWAYGRPDKVKRVRQ
jgi:hypothetical protein